MLLFSSCSEATNYCKQTRTFAVAHLYNDDVPMKIHIHDTYEIYYSISGGRQFLIDNRFYDFQPGDLFFINQYESHYLSQLDEARHERIVISIYPEYLISCSSPRTDLNECFSRHNVPYGHRISLSADEQSRFMYYIHRFQDIGSAKWGGDVLERAVFTEMMLFLNQLFRQKNEAFTMDNAIPGAERPTPADSHYSQVDRILTYINQNISQDLSIEKLAEHFYMSSSGISRIFKEATGTTLNRYITAKRITCAKGLLAQGRSVTDACLESGFRDYSNFFKAFSRAVGMSPKKYAAASH